MMTSNQQVLFGFIQTLQKPRTFIEVPCTSRCMTERCCLVLGMEAVINLFRIFDSEHHGLSVRDSLLIEEKIVLEFKTKLPFVRVDV